MRRGNSSLRDGTIVRFLCGIHNDNDYEYEHGYLVGFDHGSSNRRVDNLQKFTVTFDVDEWGWLIDEDKTFTDIYPYDYKRDDVVTKYYSSCEYTDDYDCSDHWEIHSSGCMDTTHVTRYENSVKVEDTFDGKFTASNSGCRHEGCGTMSWTERTWSGESNVTLHDGKLSGLVTRDEGFTSGCSGEWDYSYRDDFIGRSEWHCTEEYAYYHEHQSGEYPTWETSGHPFTTTLSPSSEHEDTGAATGTPKTPIEPSKPDLPDEACLPAGEPIPLADGSVKAVENVSIGDEVFVPDQGLPEGLKKRCKIVKLYQNAPQPILTLKLQHKDNGTVFEQHSTPGHRFYVRNQGFVHAEEIPIGAELTNEKNEPIILLEKNLDPTPVPVYNFQVEGAHTYFVGESPELCVLSHNQGCDDLLPGEDIREYMEQEKLLEHDVREKARKTITKAGEMADLALDDIKNIPQKIAENIDSVQGIADFLGNTPFVGGIIDAVNGAVYFWRGKIADAFFSWTPGVSETKLAGIIGAGILGVAAKFLGKHGDEAGKTALNAVEEMVDHADEIRGGVYVLKDGDDVVRVGRTNDLRRRAREHKLDNDLKEFNFEPVHKTNDYPTQRGLEQQLHDDLGKPPFDKINPISPNNPNRPKYMKAAEDFLNQ